MTRFVTLKGNTFKSFIVLVDVSNILLSIAGTQVMMDPTVAEECRSEYSTLYKIGISSIVLGFFAVFRMIYFICAHWYGPKYC